MNSQKSSSKQDRMLPVLAAAVLRIRDNGDNVCPEDILRRIESLKIGKVVYHFKAGAAPPANTIAMHHSSSNNSLNSSSPGGGWRGSRGFGGNTQHGGGNNHSNNHTGGGRSTGDGGGGAGFRQSSWDRPLAIRRVPSDLHTPSTPREEESPYRRFRHPQSNTPSPSDQTMSPSFPPGGRYVSSIVSEKNVEDRIIGHIRSKLNKFSHKNYDSVKSFLEQIMNSGELEFISEFMDLLFTKAGSEENYCELYSRLLSELTAKFPHLVTEISTIYSNYILIFQEARDVPDQGTDDYKKFLDAQAKKKFRYGYSHFLAEIYNKGLLPADAIEVTVKAILDSLSKIEKDASNTLLVEEYLASLFKIVSTVNITKTAPYPPYIDNMIDALKKIIEKPKDVTTGYTIKARFKIMDIVESLPN
jgi:hypothetical protein